MTGTPFFFVRRLVFRDAKNAKNSRIWSAGSESHGRNPFGAVTEHDLLECATPATSVGFRIEPPAKLFRTLDGSGIGGGIGIADGESLPYPTSSG
jgi:hypothetical protein